MHTRWIVLLALLLAGSAALAFRVMRPKKVTAARVVRGTAVEAVYASGTVEAIDRAELRARVAGPLVELRVREGDPVHAGELLGRIEARNLGYDVARGQAELRGAVQRAANAPAIAQLRAQADAMRAQLAQARSDLARVEQLARTGAAAPQDLDRARNAAGNLAAQLDAILAAERDLRIQLETEAARQRAGVASLQARANDTEVRSPMDGIVLARLVEQGQTVGVNDAVLRVGDVRRLQIESQVDEADIARVRVGMTAGVRFYAYQGRAFRAHVTRIAPDADRTRKTFEVDLELDPPPEGLRPGMTAEIDIVTEQHDGVALTSPDAVHDGRVWVVDGRGHIRSRAVRIGIRDLLRVEITRGVAPGDLVVLGALAGAHEGMRVDARIVPLPQDVPAAPARSAITP